MESPDTLSNKSDSPKKEIIVISGSSGLIGTALINELAQNYTIVGLDNTGYPFPPITAECICVDITSDKSMEIGMDRIRYAYGDKIASVIHLAAYYDFKTKDSPLYDKITVKGTERLMRVLKGFTVEQFIFSSSLLVYKPTSPGVKITESSALEPKWGYPKSKVETEKLLQTERGNIPVLNLRIAGVYNNEGNSIPITHQVQRIYENQITSHFYPGNMAHGNPYLHLNDLTSAIYSSVRKRKDLSGFETINLGEPETMSFLELQQTISRLLHNKEWKTYNIPKSIAKLGAGLQDVFGDPFIKPWMVNIADDHMELDISKAVRLLDWNPQQSLKKTLPDIINKLKSNPEKFYKDNNLKK